VKNQRGEYYLFSSETKGGSIAFFHQKPKGGVLPLFGQELGLVFSPHVTFSLLIVDLTFFL
jgi:hypothetical protein